VPIYTARHVSKVRFKYQAYAEAPKILASTETGSMTEWGACSSVQIGSTIQSYETANPGPDTR